MFALVATTLIPFYYTVILTYYYKQDYRDKKYPEGIVTVENIAKEGETLGERVTQLDRPDIKKKFGQSRVCVRSGVRVCICLCLLHTDQPPALLWGELTPPASKS